MLLLAQARSVVLTLPGSDCCFCCPSVPRPASQRVFALAIAGYEFVPLVLGLCACKLCDVSGAKRWFEANPVHNRALFLRMLFSQRVCLVNCQCHLILPACVCATRQPKVDYDGVVGHSRTREVQSAAFVAHADVEDSCHPECGAVPKLGYSFCH